MSAIKAFLIAAGICVCAGLPFDASCASLAFAQNFATGAKQVVRFPVDNPSGMTVLGPLSDTMTGMDFDPGTSVLWAIDLPEHALGTVDSSTGAFTQTVVLTDTNINAFTIDPVTGMFYVAKGDHLLYSLDPLSGETTTIGAAATVGAPIRALAVDCGGRVFALTGNSTDPNVLFRTLPGAAPASVGTSEFSGATSLEFDNRTGTLYASFNASGADTSTYATLDASTAATTPVAALAGRYRIAIRAECSIFADDFEA